MDNISLRCNVDGHVPGDDVQTARVEAGSTISWIVEPYVYHPGPISFFMTKVHDANRASGSTEWFKVHDIGPQFTPKGGDWSATQQRMYIPLSDLPKQKTGWFLTRTHVEAFDVTIPPCLASGEYLMRIQQVGVHVPGKAPQFHISCAQLRVFGSGTELPPAKYMVNIPGVFKRDDPGFTQNIYLNFKEYTIPGGDVWACEK